MASRAIGDPPNRNHSTRQVMFHNGGPHDNSREHRPGERFAGMEHYLDLADKVLKPKHKHETEANSRSDGTATLRAP